MRLSPGGCAQGSQPAPPALVFALTRAPDEKASSDPRRAFGALCTPEAPSPAALQEGRTQPVPPAVEEARASRLLRSRNKDFRR